MFAGEDAKCSVSENGTFETKYRVARSRLTHFKWS